MDFKLTSAILTFILPFFACNAVKATDPLIYDITKPNATADATRDTLFFLLRTFGNVMTAFLILSPVPTIKRILEKMSIEEFSYLPYAAALLELLLTMWYDLPHVARSTYYLDYTVNGLGSAVELSYLVIFLIHAPLNEKFSILALILCVFAIFTIVIIVSVSAIEESSSNIRRLFCGTFAALSSFATYASPLIAMRTVEQTKNLEFMPPLLSLSSFLCAATWFIIGHKDGDMFVYIPSLLGSVVAAGQLIFYWRYRKKGKNQAATLEMEGPSQTPGVEARQSSCITTSKSENSCEG